MPREAEVAELPLAVRQAVKRKVLSDMLEPLDPEDAFDRMVALTVEQLIDEDPDLAPLEPLREKLVAYAKFLMGLPDALKGQQWTRFPCEIVRNGTWASMTGGERRMYGALLGYVDGKTLTTMMGRKKLAKAAGLREGQASRALTGLKKRGLIQRWQQRHGPHKPYFTRILPRGCFKDPHDAHVLDAAAMPKDRGARH